MPCTVSSHRSDLHVGPAHADLRPRDRSPLGLGVADLARARALAPARARERRQSGACRRRRAHPPLARDARSVRAHRHRYQKRAQRPQAEGRHRPGRAGRGDRRPSRDAGIRAVPAGACAFAHQPPEFPRRGRPGRGRRWGRCGGYRRRRPGRRDGRPAQSAAPRLPQRLSLRVEDDHRRRPPSFARRRGGRRESRRPRRRRDGERRLFQRG